MRIILGSIILSLAVSACSGGEADGNAAPAATQASATLVSADYRKSFDRAWERAGEGRSPTSACASVVGRAVGLLKTTATEGQPRADALAALDACYVQAIVRYVIATLSVEAVGATQCASLLQALPVHRRSLGGFLDDVGEDRAAYDRRLDALIGDKVRSACPDSAWALLDG